MGKIGSAIKKQEVLSWPSCFDRDSGSFNLGLWYVIFFWSFLRCSQCDLAEQPVSSSKVQMRRLRSISGNIWLRANGTMAWCVIQLHLPTPVNWGVIYLLSTTEVSEIFNLCVEVGVEMIWLMHRQQERNIWAWVNVLIDTEYLR